MIPITPLAFSSDTQRSGYCSFMFSGYARLRASVVAQRANTDAKYAQRCVLLLIDKLCVVSSATPIAGRAARILAFSELALMSHNVYTFLHSVVRLVNTVSSVIVVLPVVYSVTYNGNHLRNTNNILDYRYVTYYYSRYECSRLY